MRLVKELEFEDWEQEDGLTKIDLGLYGDFEAEELRIYSDGSTTFYGVWYPLPFAAVQMDLPENTESIKAELRFSPVVDPDDVDFISELISAEWYSWDIYPDDVDSYT